MNWQERLHDCMASECLPVITETLSDLCLIHVPLKCRKNKYVSKFYRERKILRRKRTKLKKTSPLTLSVLPKLFTTERDLVSSHQKEKMFEVSLAVTKIKSDSKFFSSDMQLNLVCVQVKLVLFMIEREVY